MFHRQRLPAAALAALLAAAGAAQAQTGRTTSTTVTTQTSPATPPAAGSAAAPAADAPSMAPPAPPAVDATPDATAAAAAGATPPSGAAFVALTPSPGADLVTVLTQSGQFTTLLKAADATNLTAVLKRPGITLFAPTDAAFAALPPGTLDNLMKPDNLPQLQKLLAYHLINARVPPIKGHARTQVATAAGTKVSLDGIGDAVKINDATALQPEVAVAGGSVVYPIDKVLSPDFTPPPAAAAETTTTTETTTTKKTAAHRSH